MKEINSTPEMGNCGTCKYNTDDYVCHPHCGGCDGVSKYEPLTTKVISGLTNSEEKLSEKTEDELIECPFCGCKTVEATSLLTFTFRNKHPVCKGGIDVKGDTFLEMFGEIPDECKPHLKFVSFHCTSCNHQWSANKHYGEYEFVKNANGLYSFLKNENVGVKRSRRE